MQLTFSSPCSALSSEGGEDLPVDFISILAVAQQFDVDFLPITWQPALEVVGEGATAEIRQSLINVQTTFAFKRPVWRWKPLSEIDEPKELRRIAAEVRALAQPEIRKHPNIITLEGLCWDILPDNKGIWPVLVFEKTSFGNLIQWLATNEGQTADQNLRRKLCADVANAISNLHSHRRLSCSPPYITRLTCRSGHPWRY